MFALGWAAVDFVANSLPLIVAYNGVLAFFGAQIPTVAVCNGFFAGQKFRHHSHIMYIGAGSLHCMNQTAVLVYNDVGLIAKVLCVALFTE